ncbi:MAG: XdhC family protein [Sporichthyaceae bacterium]
MSTQHPVSDACLTAHGGGSDVPSSRSLVVVYSGEIARHLVTMAQACGYRVAVVEPDAVLAAKAASWMPAVVTDPGRVATDDDTDVVVCDHHREDLGSLLAGFLDRPVRWIGVIGNARTEGPHVALLTDLGRKPDEIARINRPIGLNIGSRTPAEIAVSILAGLLADRTDRPGGFASS